MRLPKISMHKRLAPSKWLKCIVPLFAIILAIITGMIALVCIGANPIQAYHAFIIGALGSAYSISEVLVKMIPLTLCGLAVALPMRANLWNIGAEGQLYFGASFGGMIAVCFPSFPWYFLLPLILVAGFVSGALWGSIAGLLKIKFKLNEILITLMLNYIAIRWYKYLIFGPFRDSSPGASGYPQSVPFCDSALLPRFFSTRLHAGIIIAIIAVILLYIIMQKMTIGYELTFVGANPVAARAGGINLNKIIWFTMFIGGGLAGLAGTSELMGIQLRMRQAISPGYGFTAIPIAWLARGHPIGVAFAAFFFGVIFVGGSHMQLVMKIPTAIAEIIQASIILFIICGDFLTRYRIRLTFPCKFGEAADNQIETGGTK